MTRHPLKKLGSALLILLIGGCATSWPSVREVPYGGWHEAYCLSNGTVEAVVVPSVGRIMRYGYIDGDNLLWQNPSVVGRAASTQPDLWTNFGGDKIYEWSQDDWQPRFGRLWPPPPGSDPLLFHAKLLADGTLQLTSDPIPSLGVRIIREIRLAPTGTMLTSTTTLEQVTPPYGDWRVAPWEVSQWRSPDVISAHLSSKRTGTGIMPMFGTFPAIQHAGDNTITMDRPNTASAKIGLDADTLGVTLGDLRITERLVDASPGDWDPGERAQMYCDQDAPPGKQPSYIELEFTSPRKALAVGEMLHLQVTWQIDQIDHSNTVSSK